MKAHPIEVRLLVKARDAEHAQAIVGRRLALVDWLVEDAGQPIVEGEGYPEGSLLWYRVVARATPPKPVPQIQG